MTSPIGKHTLVTDTLGNAILDVNGDDEGDYTAQYDFAGDTTYQESTLTKDFKIKVGNTTRILVNGEELTAVTGKYFDNTSLNVKVQYTTDDGTTWIDKDNYTVTATITSPSTTFTLTNQNPILKLNTYDVGTYTITFNYAKETGYLPSTSTLTYTQAKNTPVISGIPSTLTLYGYQSQTLTPVLKTSEGNVLPNKTISLSKQGTDYTSITNNKGEANFSSSLNITGSTNKFSDDCTSDKTSNYTGSITYDTDHYVLNGTTQDTAVKISSISSLADSQLIIDAETSSFGIISIKSGVESLNITITPTNISVGWVYDLLSVSRNSKSRIKIMVHGNVVSVFNDGKLVVPISLHSAPTGYNFFGDFKLYNVMVDSLPTSTILASDTLNFTFTGDDNLNTCTSSCSLTMNEFQTETLSYLIDGYSSNKVTTINSTFSIPTKNTTDYGFIYNNNGTVTEINKASFRILDYYTINNVISPINLVIFYSKKENYAYSYIRVNETIATEDWQLKESTNYTGLNISLETGNATVPLNTEFTLTAGLGVKNQTLKLYRNGTLKTTATTDNTGYATFTLTETVSNTYAYKIVYDGKDDFPSATSNTLNILVSKNATTLSLSSNKTSVAVGGTFTLSSILGLTNKTIRIYQDDKYLGTCTTGSNGIGYYTVTLSTLKDNYKFQAFYDGDTDSGASQSTPVYVSCSKTTPTITVTKTSNSIYVGDTFTINVTTNPVLASKSLTISYPDGSTGTLTTDTNGTTSTTRSETNTGLTGNYVVSYPGDDYYNAASGSCPVPTVNSRPKTSTSLEFTRCDYESYPGYVISGHLSPSISGQTINATIIRQGSTIQSTNVTTDSSGNFSFTITASGSDTTLNQVAITYAGNDDYSGSSAEDGILIHNPISLTTSIGSVSQEGATTESNGYAKREWWNLTPSNLSDDSDDTYINCGINCDTTSHVPIMSVSSPYRMPRTITFSDFLSDVPSNCTITQVDLMIRSGTIGCNDVSLSIARPRISLWLGNSSYVWGYGKAPTGGSYTNYTTHFTPNFKRNGEDLIAYISYPANQSSQPGILRISKAYTIIYYIPNQS